MRRTEQAGDTPVVVITGGTSGIGRSTARLFAARGWRVGLIARGEEALDATVAELRELGTASAAVAADVVSDEAVMQAAATLAATLGPIALWINCAGNGVYGRFAEVSDAEFRRVTDVTYHGTVNGTRAALAQMAARDSGVIINVCSGIAFHGLPLLASYAGAKAAVRGFGQSLETELRMAGSGIRVVTVFPPAVNTPFFSHAVSHMGWPARPARPVYQAQVIAEAIHRAASGRRPEVRISFTVSAFSLVARAAPGFTRFLLRRMGLDGQLATDPDALALHEPTLFAPSSRLHRVDGPFGRHARSWSLQLALGRLSLPRWPAWLRPRAHARPAEPAPAEPGPPGSR
jgi:short-subunit dehydrogenase